MKMNAMCVRTRFFSVNKHQRRLTPPLPPPPPSTPPPMKHAAAPPTASTSTGQQQRHLRHRAIVHPLTGRPFRCAPTRSVHTSFVKSESGVGHHRTAEIIRNALLRKSYRPRSRHASTNPHVLRRLFRTYDTDESGGLEFPEFCTLLHDIGVQAVSKTDCRLVFDAYDINGDGSISYDEWCDVLCRHFTDVRGSVITVPSHRLDVRHASMTADEADADLRRELRRAHAEGSLPVVRRSTTAGPPRPPAAAAPPASSSRRRRMTTTTLDAAREQMMDAGVGIGNEAAIDALLDRCCSQNDENGNGNDDNEHNEHKLLYWDDIMHDVTRKGGHHNINQ